MQIHNDVMTTIGKLTRSLEFAQGQIGDLKVLEDTPVRENNMPRTEGHNASRGHGNQRGDGATQERSLLTSTGEWLMRPGLTESPQKMAAMCGKSDQFSADTLRRET